MLCCTMLHTTRLDKNGQNNSSSTRYLYRKKRISSKTNMTRSFIAVFVVVFLIRKGVTGVLTNVPSNAVAEVGGQAIFNCTSSLTLQNWIFAKSRDDVSASLGQDIAVNCAIQPGFETHYEVDRPGGSTNVCNLIVKATTMQQAGTYTCSDTVYGPSAILTVIDPILVLTRNSTTAQEEAVEGESVMFECVLNYNGTIEPTPTLRPYFYWTNSTGENITSYSDSTTENKAVSQFEVTAQRGNNITAYTCHVYFKLNLTNTPNYASNTPAVNISDSSRTIEVLYVPSTPIITNRTGVIGINGVLCGISILTCSSSGNPVPSYRWFDSVQTLLSSNDTLDLAEINRSYKCEAYNTIRNVIHEASAEHNVTKGNCFSTVDCCEFPHNETTKLTDKGCINGTAQCDCSQGNSVIALFCNATTYPNASYIWSGPGISDVPSNSAVFDKVSANGTYTCIAYFDRTSSNYSGDVIFTNGTDNATVNECSEGWKLVVSFVVQFVGGNVIFLIVFSTACWNWSEFRRIMDKQFSVTGHMVKVVLLVIASVFFGLILIPIAVTIASRRSLRRGSVGKATIPMDGGGRPNTENNEQNDAGTDDTIAMKDGGNTGKNDQNDSRTEDTIAMNNENYQQNDGKTKDGNNMSNVAATDGGIAIWIIVLMWCVDIVLLFPTSLIVVYFVDYNSVCCVVTT